MNEIEKELYENFDKSSTSFEEWFNSDEVSAIKDEEMKKFYAEKYHLFLIIKEGLRKAWDAATHQERERIKTSLEEVLSRTLTELMQDNKDLAYYENEKGEAEDMHITKELSYALELYKKNLLSQLSD